MSGSVTWKSGEAEGYQMRSWGGTDIGERGRQGQTPRNQVGHTKDVDLQLKIDGESLEGFKQ